MKQKLYYLPLILIVLGATSFGAYWYVRSLNQRLATLELASYQHKAVIYSTLVQLCNGDTTCADEFINKALSQ